MGSGSGHNIRLGLAQSIFLLMRAGLYDRVNVAVNRNAVIVLTASWKAYKDIEVNIVIG